MKDLKYEGKEIKSELKVGGQDNRGKQPGAYNPQQKQPLNNTTQRPLPGKGQTIGDHGGVGINKDKGFSTGNVDLNKKKGETWK
jgi:hypothetical protein